ncbi:hypothetical protein M3616_05330 [Bacillus velezensis]|uniref:hypothetical protein n=1 Tax=Bacillus velezensis TaxID=492670 RepID=UPI0008498970|nr:hypothetical protein [Bacillus velezensis]MCA1232014.1 hypothetical protein [Bacillus velezensis]MCA1310296.1 hypothetical protein [Bacillus velezensis]MCA1329292.1 hypothetical protein [Bacillus velezensis]MCM3275577.1 hypothetical protein [Bacillus velezensis]MCM3348657.1 hypothetical protein [Bacillus velezensis]
MSKKNDVEFVVVVVDTAEQARIIESSLRTLNTDRVRFQALYVGQQALGWQFRGTRPTTVILAYSALRTEQQHAWEREVVGRLGYNNHPTRKTNWITLNGRSSHDE